MALLFLALALSFIVVRIAVSLFLSAFTGAFAAFAPSFTH